MSDIIATDSAPNHNSSSRNGTNKNTSVTHGRARVQSHSSSLQQKASTWHGRPTQRHAMDSATAEATCRKIVSVLALDAGFEGITASALESLTRSLESYTQQMYSTAHSFAELAGRTRPNIHDLQQAFIDMNLNPASLESYVRTASQSKTPLLRGPLQETIAKPFKKKEKKTLFLDSDIEDNSDSDEDDPAVPTSTTPGTKVTARTIVPDHLPVFPSKHSYKQTPVFVQRPTDPQKIRELNAEQSRLVESNLKRLMAAENKVAMAAAHKDGSTAGVTTTDLLMVKEEHSEHQQQQQESADAIDRRALTKLEALPVVNYEFSKRQQQLTASNRESRHQAQLLDFQSGHLRGDSSSNGVGSSSSNNMNGAGVGAASGAGVGGAASSSAAAVATAGHGTSIKAEWRKERRRMRKEQQGAMEELEQNLNHKRLRQDSVQNASLKLVSMDVDPQ